MRVIKFRAWDNRDKYWYDDMNVSSDGKIFQVDADGYFDYLSDVIVMQFTGLHDLNGREIYEGDIIQHRTWRRNADGSTTLSKQNEYMDKRVVEYETQSPFIGFSIQEDSEIIGNIYDTPELLDEAK